MGTDTRGVFIGKLRMEKACHNSLHLDGNVNG
jgi:hypothetical protein